MIRRLNRYRSGAIALMTIVIISAFTLAIMTAASITANRSLTTVSTTVSGEKTFDSAEAGIQDALYRLGSNPNTTSYALPNSVTGTPVTITIDQTAGSKSVTAQAAGSNSIVRTLKIGFHASTFGGFNGAVLAGNGGFALGNGSTISGDICSNGNIDGSNGATITGNVDVDNAGNHLDNTDITGQVRVDTITSSDVTGSVAFGAGGASHYSGTRTRATISGSYQNCPNGLCAATFDPASVSCPFPPMPAYAFTTNTADPDYNKSFHAAAAAGGTTNCSPTCTVSGSPNLVGPRIYSGNVVIDIGATLTLTGPVWITGTLTVRNNATVLMDTTPGTFPTNISTALVAEQAIDADNNGITFAGIPAQKSYLMIVSTAANITVKNGSTSVVFYAPNGTLDVKNNCPTGTCLNNATAQRVVLGNNVGVQYDSGLQDLIFSGSSQVIVTPTPSSWQEL